MAVTEGTTPEEPQQESGSVALTGEGQPSEDESTTDRSNALRKAYGAATARLREGHREEFDRLYVEEAKKLGVDYKPKPTAEQKAEEQLRALLAEHPGLRSKIAPPAAQ